MYHQALAMDEAYWPGSATAVPYDRFESIRLERRTFFRTGQATWYKTWPWLHSYEQIRD